MSDYNSSMPIRTEANGDVVSHIADGTISTQLLKVNADGSIDTNTSLPAGTKIIITDGVDDLEINGDGSINAVVTATDLDIRDLTFANDKVDVSGSNVTVTATDLDIRDLSHLLDSIKIGDGVEFLAINPDGSINAVVTATDLDIRNLSSATDSVEVLQDTHDDLNANANLQVGDVDVSATNPVPVAITGDQVGDEICDYNTSAAVAKDASVNHDYTVSAGKTFLGEEAWISGSGKLKAEVLINGATVFVGFNSTANPNIRIPMEKICKGNAAEVIRFTITNRDNQPQDLYSTLLGLEV